MNRGDQVIYHEANGIEHTATVIAVTSETTCSVAFVSNGRDREAHHISSTPGLTGECWKPAGNTTKDATPEEAATEPTVTAPETAEANEDAEDDSPIEDPNT